MPENSSEPVQAVVLHALHLQLGARMVPFAGYQMPLQYPSGIKQEHLHTRAAAGLFDVSHMGQVLVRGRGAARALEALVPVELESLAVDKQVYGVFTNSRGGIEDDLIITRWGEERFFLVVNAACKVQDIAYLRASLPGCDIEELDRALLALQGPRASEVMANLVPEATALSFMNGCAGMLAGTECYVTRSGYTGEDGFEISVPSRQARAVADALLAFEAVQPIGLGARDSLRLEAGLCLYGHDMDSATTPIEASLAWSISPSRRRQGAKAGGFPGSDHILGQMQHGVRRKRVGLRVEGRAPVREGAPIEDASGATVGKVTSGGFSPSLDAPIAMGYVDAALASPGTGLTAMVRGKPRPVVVAKMPFVEQRYHRNG
jgi:aminomethyltransferase